MRASRHPSAWEAVIRFYFHLWKGRELIADEEGSELPHLEAAYLEAFASAQELWAVLLAQREDPTRCSFEVVDGAGKMMFVLPLNEVLETTQKGPPPRKLAAMDRTSELLLRTQVLRQSLAEQIEAARSTVVQTGEILSALRHRREAGR